MTTDRNYIAIKKYADLERRINAVIDAGLPFGFDIEAGYHGADREEGSLRPFHPDWQFAGFSFTNSEDWAVYVPMWHDDGDNIDDVLATIRLMWKLLQTGQAVIHNAAYELRGCSRIFRDFLSDDPEYGEAVQNSFGLFPFLYDSMLEVHMLNMYDPMRIGKDLKNLTKEVFGHQMLKLPELIKSYYQSIGRKPPTEKKIRFTVLPVSFANVVEYACEDAIYCLKLSKYHQPMLRESRMNFLFGIEQKLLPVLIEMEIEGVLLDWDLISKKTQELDRFRDLYNEWMQQQISERLGRPMAVNLMSSAQIQKLLFSPKPEGFGLTPKKFSKTTGAPSADEKALNAIAKQDPIMRGILEYREIDKLYGSYLNKYNTQLNYSGNGRARPSHKQEGAGTGRLSVGEVSYQQWPKPYHYELPGGITYEVSFKDLLLAPEGFRVVGYDFSQVELRVIASLANESAMIEAFQNDIDIHKATASRMFGVPVDQVTKPLRQKGKTGNFAVVFQAGAKSMGEQMGTSTEEAQEMLDQYYAGFPSLRNWMNKIQAEGSASKEVYTYFGRKFTIWEYFSTNGYIRSKGDRLCINAPVQGTAADYMKIGMVRVNKAIKKAEKDGLWAKGAVRLIMTIHDALEFYVRNDVPTQLVIDTLDPAVTPPIPGFPVAIRADWHEGRTWGGVVEIKMDKQKQITHYMIEDIDIIFDTVESAYAHLDKLRAEHAQELLDLRAAGLAAPPEPEPEAPRAPLTVAEQRWADRVDDEDFWDAVTGAPASQETSEPEEEVEPQQVVITLEDMPDSAQWTAFLAFLDQRPGQDSLLLVTPEGEQIVEGVLCDVRETDQPELSLMMGGASITHQAVDLEESIMEGITL